MQKTYLLSELLLQSWKNYERRVHLSTNKMSTKNIHGLRISAQRLEAILSLVHTLDTTHLSQDIIVLVKKLRKGLSPLRDIQVEELTINNLGKNGKDNRELNRFFAKEKKKAKEKAYRCLHKISLKQECFLLVQLVEKLVSIEEYKTERQIQDPLDHKINSMVQKFNQVRAKVIPKCVKDIHKLRILAKKLRYQQECLNSMTRDQRFDLKNLRTVQSVAGRIQNESVLIQTLDHYLSQKGRSHDPTVMKAKRRLKIKRGKIIKTEFSQLKP